MTKDEQIAYLVERLRKAEGELDRIRDAARDRQSRHRHPNGHVTVTLPATNTRDSPPSNQKDLQEIEILGESVAKRDSHVTRRSPETSLPDNFDALIQEDDITWVQEQLGFTPQQILLETEHFKTKAKAKDWRYRDWRQAWRNWFLQEVKFRARAS